MQETQSKTLIFWASLALVANVADTKPNTSFLAYVT